MVDFEVNTTRNSFQNDLTLGWWGFAAGIADYIRAMGFNKTRQILVEVKL